MDPGLLEKADGRRVDFLGWIIGEVGGAAGVIGL
jgi:hypothetical protein